MPTETTTSDIARRVRALLDKAENTEFVHERDAFTAKAMHLMASHRITEAMVDASRDSIDRRGRIGDRVVALGSGPYVRARLALLCNVADPNDISVVTHVEWDGRVATMHGYLHDLERTELLYTSLLVQATNEAHRVAVPTGGSAVSVRRSFLFGFATTVGERLVEIHREAAVEADEQRPVTGFDRPASVALVLADRRADVDDYVRRRYGRIGSLRATRVAHQGYDEGVRAGHRADLGTRRDLAANARGALGR